MTVADQIATHLVGLDHEGVLLVAVDGVDGVGKTTFADTLASVLRQRNRSVIRSSVDGFHRARAFRYRLGRDSPAGFYRDSYDYDLLRRLLLDPLSVGGSMPYSASGFDHLTDAPTLGSEQVAAPGAILVFDGLFLHRPELRSYWDFSIFLDAPFEVTVPRGAARGAGFGDPDPRAPSNRRYVEGNEIYLREVDPKGHATVVVDNTDLERPWIVDWRR